MLANYQRELDIRDHYRDWSDGNLDMLCKTVATRLSNLRPFPDDYLEFEKLDIVDAFNKLGENDDVTDEEFDNLMERLYIWGEHSLGNNMKVCIVRIA